MQDVPKMAIKDQPRLLQILGYQHELDERIQSKIKDLCEINNRLDVLANRLNATDYPKNQPQTTGQGEPGNQLAPAPTKPDGIVGELIAVNERGSRRLDEVQNVVTSIYIALNYLEQHI